MRFVATSIYHEKNEKYFFHQILDKSTSQETNSVRFLTTDVYYNIKQTVFIRNYYTQLDEHLMI